MHTCIHPSINSPIIHAPNKWSLIHPPIHLSIHSINPPINLFLFPSACPSEIFFCLSVLFRISVPNSWQMCFGKHHINSSMDGPTEVCVPVVAIISHKDFVYPQINDLANDIALVRLAKPVSMTREISPVCLPKPESLMPAGHFCYVTGWGDEKGQEEAIFSETKLYLIIIVKGITLPKITFISVRVAFNLAYLSYRQYSSCSG